MIKGFKVNYFQFFRSKALLVISIILVVCSILGGFIIKFVSDDPTGIIQSIREALVESNEESYKAGYLIGSRIAENVKSNSDNSSSEDELQVQSEKELEVEYHYDESTDSLVHAIDSISSSDSFYGILEMDFGSTGSYILMCVFVALFVGSSFKSRFHINLFSLNVSPQSIVAMQLLSLISLFIIIDLVCFASTFLITYIFCNSFSYALTTQFYTTMTVYLLTGLAYLSLTYMIAFLRKGPVLAIVLTSLASLGIADIFVEIISIFVTPARFLSLNYGLNNATYSQSFGVYNFAGSVFSLIIYTCIFTGVTFLVASKRDAY